MARFHAAITGVGGYVPDYVMTNQELETMVETNDEWIRSRTGISERRILKGEGQGASVMAIEAVKEVLQKTNTDPSEIEVVICGTVTEDYRFPDTANLIADACGITNAFGFDIHAACSGFLFSLTTGAKFIEAGTHKKVLVIGVDKMSSILNYEDRSTCIIFGDGAGAVLLEATETDEGIIDSVLRSNGGGRDHLNLQAGGSVNPASHDTVDKNMHYVYQNGRPVFKSAIEGMSDVVQQVIARNNLKTDDITWLVPHQANKRIIEKVAETANFPMERVMMNIQRYGNTTAATIPLCLWDYEKQIKKGDYLILTAFGGSFTWGATLLKWAY
jgi:3-oxoacyl-[acyl-carrier-protein] synthase-3